MDIPGYNTPMFSLHGLKTTARIVDIVDGDTVYLVIPLFNTFFKFNCRILGIDTCEKNGENKQLGILSTNFSYEFFTGQKGLSRKTVRFALCEQCVLVDIECYEFDKYGRLLVNIYFNGISFATELLNQRIAYVYNGGKKLTMDEQRVILTTNSNVNKT